MSARPPSSTVTGKTLARAALGELRRRANPADAEFLQRFFKTGPGQYAEGDLFLGIRVPAVREIARRFSALPLTETFELLQAREHEARLLALILLARLYERADAATRARVFHGYLEHRQHINNWDLVDVSAPGIVGRHLHEQRARGVLKELSGSAILWDRRIAIVSTQYFIRLNDFEPTLRVARRLVGDREDLIHKAVGWMLREVGKRDRAAEEAFLREHAHAMPRTMLRYALEHFPPPLRAHYMKR